MDAELSPRSPRILVCDDEPMVREVLQATLRSASFDAVCVGSIDEAEGSFGAAAQSFDAAIVDRRLGAESGVELIGRLRSLRSDLPVLLVSGVHERPAELERIAGPAVALLPKPFRPSALLAALRGVLSSG